MKKVMKSFTFWLLLFAVIEIVMHQIGQDSKSIVLISLNPILHRIANSDGFLYDFMQSGLQVPCNTISGQISIYWYFGAMLTLPLYGIMLDFVKWGLHQLHNKK